MTGPVITFIKALQYIGLQFHSFLHFIKDVHSFTKILSDEITLDEMASDDDLARLLHVQYQPPLIMLCRVGRHRVPRHQMSGHRCGQHHPCRKGRVLVVVEPRVYGKAHGGGGGGGAGGSGQAVRVEVADGGLGFLRWGGGGGGGDGGEAGVGRGPVPGQVGVVQEVGGNGVGLAGVGQRVLHRALQLHAPVLEPVPHLEEAEEVWS